MAYKKYLNINGKRFGPYYYESYRDKSGKVRKKYIGKTKVKEEKENKTRININLFYILFIFLIIISTIFILKMINADNNFNTQDGIHSLGNSEGSITEWLMFRRWLNHTAWDGVSYTTIQGLNRANYTTNDRIDSSPTVANGYVYIGSDDKSLYQLNASNVSQKIANYATGSFVKSSPTVANGYVYIGSDDKSLYQLNASNVSQKIASYTTSGAIRSSPAVANGFVYVGSEDKNLYQLNASNVSQKIANYTTGNLIEFSSPAVANGFVYVGSWDYKLYQLNASNVSQLIASYTAENLIDSSPAVANGFVYVGDYNKNIYQLNASNVSQLISNYSGGLLTGYILSSPALANGYLYIGFSDGTLNQFNATNVSQRIAYYLSSTSFYSSPAVANGFVYVGNNDGNSYQLNASNVSQKIASYTTGYAGSSSPAVANGYFYIGNNVGRFWQINSSNISLANNFPDTTSPIINITYPLSITYSINVSVMNYTIIESNPSKCWYSNSSGIWNSTTQNSGTNFTNVISIEGNNTWTVYCNDTSGNIGNKTVSFIKDTTPPTITFSCSPTSVNTGETITCSCSATDNVDASVNVSYTANPSTSNTGTFTTSCTSTDSSGNSAASSVDYTVNSGGGSCTINWVCGEYGECVNGLQTRDCTNSGTCLLSPKTENQTCSETPLINPPSTGGGGGGSGGGSGGSWICGNWSECYAVYNLDDIIKGNVLLRGERKKTCTQDSLLKIERESCRTKIPIITKKSEKCFKTFLEVYNLNMTLISRLQLIDGNYTKLNLQFNFDNSKYCDYCYNGIKDYDEDETDCNYNENASCPVCIKEIKKGILCWILFIISMLLFFWLLFELLRKRNEYSETEELKRFRRLWHPES